MNTLETLKIKDSYGLEIDGEINLAKLKNYFDNSLALTSGWVKTKPVYFVRDQFNLLHIFKEKLHKKYFGISASIANISTNVIDFPLMGIGFTHNNYFYDGVDYTFVLPEYDIDKTAISQKILQRKEEKALKSFFKEKNSEKMLSLMHKNFQIKAYGKNKHSESWLFYYLGHKKTTTQSHSDITLEDGSQKKFLRRSIHYRSSRGTNKFDFLNQKDILLKKLRGSNITLERDEDDPKNFLITIVLENYRRKLNRQYLQSFISSLNHKFSLSSHNLFYKNYTLPPASEVDLYRKIYAMTNIYCKGYDLLEKIKNLDLNLFRKKTKIYFQDRSVFMVSDLHRFKDPFYFISHKIAEKLLLRSLKKVKKLAQKDSPNPQKILSRLGKLVYRMHIERYGIGLLKQIVGPSSLFVMGRIAGINRSFSSLEELQTLATKRFMGHSWGQYQVVPPTLSFLRYGRFFLPSTSIAPAVSLETLLGRLPEGYPTKR